MKKKKDGKTDKNAADGRDKTDDRGLNDGLASPWRVSQYFGSGRDRDYFIEQLSVLLSSGMDLLSALSSIRDEMSSRKMKKLLNQVYWNVEQGMPLWRALEHSKVMPRYFVALVEIGESSGNLVENLKVVSLQYQKDKAFRSKVSAAMVYPVFVLIVTAAVGLATAMLVLPRITGIYQRMDVELNIFTLILIGMGNFFKSVGVVAVPAFLLLLGVALFFLFYHKKTKFVGEAVLLRLPGISPLIVEVELSRFGYIMGNLLDSGVPVVDALDLLGSLTSFRVYKRFYRALGKEIAEGKSFRQSFDRYRGVNTLFPISFQRLIISGEQSGGLSESLSRMSEIYEEKIEVTSRNLTVVLEPLLLIIVWCGVAIVALGAITPMYGLIGNISSTTSRSGQDESSGTVVVKDESAAVFDGKQEDEETYASEGEGINEDTEDENQNILEIEDTGTDFLNVRDVPGGSVVTTVTPGELYVYVDFMKGWYQIILEDGTLGWVSAEYVDAK
jgi:type IV pilus assembly protein PilC